MTQRSDSATTIFEYLSVRSRPASSDTGGHPDTSECHSFTQIGAGACGTVYEHSSHKAVCIKKEEMPPYPDRNLENDFDMHCSIYAAFNKYDDLDVHVPIPNHFVLSDDQAFYDCQTLFPSRDRRPSNLLYSERIPTLPRALREAMIDQYRPPNLKEKALTHPANNHCLIRPYLGRNKRLRSKSPMFFNLANHCMFLDQLLDLTLDLTPLISAMAKAFAIMHWDVKFDARDVEFVLGAHRH